jgi:two-component system chemotaxis response regulator CheB
VLSGLLDDGTSGSWAIKQSGGICIVQEPTEAEFPDMPANVLNNVDVDFQVPIADMGYILADLLSKPFSPIAEVPQEIRLEAEMTETLTSDIDTLQKIAEHSRFICPDCGGGLWKMKKDGIHRYRCHTGHVYTEKVLLLNQNEKIEESIWVSVRMLEERRNLLLSIAGHDTELDNPRSSAEYRLRADQMNTHIERLKGILQAFSVYEPND